jgi:hypothetical protein
MTYQRERWFISSVSDVRIMWNITTEMRVDRVTSTQDEGSELRQRLIRDDTSGGELLVIGR